MVGAWHARNNHTSDSIDQGGKGTRWRAPGLGRIWSCARLGCGLDAGGMFDRQARPALSSQERGHWRELTPGEGSAVVQPWGEIRCRL